MEKNFDFKQVPNGWALCFLDACDRKAMTPPVKCST